ncbi:MAG: TlpA family protein disulfide reductase [Nitrospirae bacterium]|nr:TlpA family protein disulfide reductase [Nitrospirota bacterium]
MKTEDRLSTGKGTMLLRSASAVIAGIAMVTLLSACQKKEAPSEKEIVFAAVGKEAPAFTLTSADGTKVSLADFSGRPVVIDFWATWCGPCREGTHELEKLHRKYDGKGVVFLGISMDEGRDAAQQVKAFAKENGLTYRMLIDDQETSRAYVVSSIPATYILDRNHILVKIYPGFLPGLGNMIAEQIEDLLK